ncbi:ammonium transporter [Nocardia stercoris]|uniref:Ammonium transporter n=1 Tax=Nocardia stercoris TaxID=2483361 RepID=A0A3M2KWW4_9NOCA|nr:ammonium transporter [Nocardia stercoris]RMI29741.1 ammonium transporter [Nocardia stercoris]
MNLRSFSAVAVPIVSTLACVNATAVANPAPAAVPDVVYKATLDGDTIHASLRDATFVVAADDRTVDVRDDAGRTVITMPLSFDQDHTEYPMSHVVSADGHQLDLTVVKDPATARPAPVSDTAADIASPAEDQLAMNSFASQFGIATAVGGFIGTALGALIGFVAGLPTGLGAIATTITGATLGGIVGTMVVGGPTLVVAGYDLINSLRSPAGTTKWANNGQPVISPIPPEDAPAQFPIPAN